jgi:hypothetical protein
MGYGSTPEEAAVGDIPAEFAKPIAVSMSPDERHAFAMLETNEPPRMELYFVGLVREGSGWLEYAGSNAMSGWLPLRGPHGESPADQAPGAVLTWGTAPDDARAAIVEFGGRPYEAPVRKGYYFLVIWGVPEETGESFIPRAERFIST